MIATRVQEDTGGRHHRRTRRRVTVLRLFNVTGLTTYLVYLWGLAGGWRMPLELTVPLALILLLGHCYLFMVLRR